MTSQTTVQMPHNGEALKKKVEQSKLKLSQIAKYMGVTHSTLLWYFGVSGLRTFVLWKASKVLRYNFFYDLGMQLPDDLPSALDTKHTQRIAELEKENERLRIENETYQKILQR